MNYFRVVYSFFLMTQRPPTSSCTDTRLPYTTLLRSTVEAEAAKAQMDEQSDFESAVAQARAERERDAELAYHEQIKALDYQYQSQLQVLQGQVTSSDRKSTRLNSSHSCVYRLRTSA